MAVTVYFRDATFLGNPGLARRYHLGRDTHTGLVAACNSRIWLNDESAAPMSDAANSMCIRCARRIAAKKEG